MLFPCPIHVNNSLLPTRVFTSYQIKTVVSRVVLIYDIVLELVYKLVHGGQSKVKLQHEQHAHSYFCLGVHVPPGVSIWGYMFIFEGTHILELFFHSKRIEAMKSDHLDVYNSDIIML